MDRLTSRTKQAQATKNKIYECGVSLIRKYGFDKVTVEQISKEAGVSVGTYYYYYESKFDLFSEIFKRADEYFEKEVSGHLEAADCKGQILEFFQRYADFNLSDGIDMIKKLYVADNKMFIAKGRAMQKTLEDIIRIGQQDNILTGRESAEELTRILFMAAHGVVFEWCLMDGEIDLNENMNQTIAYLVNGLMN